MYLRFVDTEDDCASDFTMGPLSPLRIGFNDIRIGGNIIATRSSYVSEHGSRSEVVWGWNVLGLGRIYDALYITEEA